MVKGQIGSASYFTDQLWDLINSDRLDEREKARSEWRANAELYARDYEGLRTRLPRDISEFFQKNDFHDYRIVDFKITQTQNGPKFPVSVVLIVSNSDDKWTIAYSRVSRISLDFISGTSSYEIGRGLDHWGYDEFAAVDHDTLSHEILFASGATLLVHFKDKHISLSRLR
ncbi:hypothetical protein [Paenibacillus macerans]|uniref:hypothetical protein n=1 Tax=Paenibacillus macerans TaxID=44252 RepID=UPI003D31A860